MLYSAAERHISKGKMAVGHPEGLGFIGVSSAKSWEELILVGPFGGQGQIMGGA